MIWTIVGIAIVIAILAVPVTILVTGIYNAIANRHESPFPEDSRDR
jgi:hypothetical protein